MKYDFGHIAHLYPVYCSLTTISMSCMCLSYPKFETLSLPGTIKTLKQVCSDPSISCQFNPPLEVFSWCGNVADTLHGRRNSDLLTEVQTKIFVDYCDFYLFGDSFWRHPFTAEEPLLSKSCKVSPNPFRWSTRIYFRWPECIFIFRCTIPLTMI